MKDTPSGDRMTAILPCNDLDASERFYTRLGFSRQDGGDDGYRILSNGNGADLHLTAAVDGWLIPGRNPFGLYLYAENVDQLAAEFAGETVSKKEPEDKPWGMYEFALSDPDETLVRVGWPTRLRAKTAIGPLIEIAVEPEHASDREEFLSAFDALIKEDPSLHLAIDAESGLIVLGGISEPQLDNAITRLKRDHELGVRCGQPQVAYREKLTRRVEIDFTHKKQSGGSGQFARVKMIFAPTEPGAGSQFVSEIVGDAVPKEYIPGVEKGFNSVLRSGILAGFPVVDVNAILVDGAYHDVDSSVLAFEIAGRGAFREALQKGACVLLEPIVSVEVTSPEDYMGFVMGDLLARRGQVRGQDMRSNAMVIAALVPLANMFGYANTLRSGTQGHGTCTMQFDHYAAAPPFGGGDDRFPPAVGMRA